MILQLAQKSKYEFYLFQHPKYAKETLLNDIKLLELEFPVNFNRVIQPVALPRIKEFKVGDVLIANGWVFNNIFLLFLLVH